MSLLNDWMAQGRSAIGADNAMLLKVWDMAGDFAVNLTVAVLILIGAVFVSKWAANGVSRALGKLKVTRADRTLTDFFAQLTRWVVLIIGVVAVLQRLGVQTTSIIAVLGAASLAIGLAIRGTLSDLAAGVMLLVLRPYRVGDMLEVDDVVGRVKRLDLFNTELATPDNRKVVLPNAKALDDMLVNRNGYAQRRVDANFDIHYDTNLDHAFAVMTRIAEAEPLLIHDHKPEPYWTGLVALKDSAMTVQLQGWVKPDDHAQALSNLLKAVKEAFDAEGIVFPYPHQVAMSDDSPLARKGKATASAAKPAHARRKPASRKPPAKAPGRTDGQRGDEGRARH